MSRFRKRLFAYGEWLSVRLGSVWCYVWKFFPRCNGPQEVIFAPRAGWRFCIVLCSLIGVSPYVWNINLKTKTIIFLVVLVQTALGTNSNGCRLKTYPYSIKGQKCDVAMLDLPKNPMPVLSNEVCRWLSLHGLEQRVPELTGSGPLREIFHSEN